MGVWSAIKAAGSWLVGGSSSSGLEIVKGVGGWIDEQQWTDQEKAEHAVKKGELYGAYLQQTMDENSERSRTRRALALLVIRWWLLMLTASAAVWKIDQAWAHFIFQIASLTAVGALVAGIGAFFFGAHLLRGYQNGKAKK